MLPVERRQFILDELYKNKAVAVNELAQQLGVTTMTIRRDLQLLEDNGLVEKSHGGAVLTESLVKEATYHNRKLVRFALGRGFDYRLIRQCIDVPDDMEDADGDDTVE